MTSRLLFFIVSTFVLGLTGGCDDGPCDHPWNGKPGSCQLPGAQEGSIGGSCRDGVFETDCDPGASCFHDVCIQCGGAGEPCCAQYSDNPKRCESGTCIEGNDAPTCDNSCGLLAPGQDKCCEGDVCSEGVCDVGTNKCTAPVSDPCIGKNGYSVSLIDINGCATEPILFTSDSDADAETCAEAIRQKLGYPKACEVNQPITHTDVCGTALGSPPSTYVIVVCDQAAYFAGCELSHCVNCTFTDGACP